MLENADKLGIPILAKKDSFFFSGKYSSFFINIYDRGVCKSKTFITHVI